MGALRPGEAGMKAPLLPELDLAECPNHLEKAVTGECMQCKLEQHVTAKCQEQVRVCKGAGVQLIRGSGGSPLSSGSWVP